MKRNKIIAVSLVVLMMVGALLLVSCSNCPGEGECKLDPADPLGSLDSLCFGFMDADADQKALDCFGDDAKTSTSKLTCGC